MSFPSSQLLALLISIPAAGHSCYSVVRVRCKCNSLSLGPPLSISHSNQSYKDLVERLFSCFNRATFMTETSTLICYRSLVVLRDHTFIFTREHVKGLAPPRVTELIRRGIRTLKVKPALEPWSSDS